MKISRIARSDIKQFYKILYRKIFGTNEKLKKRQCQRYSKWDYSQFRFGPIIDIDILKDAEISDTQQKRLLWLADQYCNHEINYLGSGWISLAYNVNVAGMEGYRYSSKHKNAAEYFRELDKNTDHKAEQESRQIRELIDKATPEYSYIQWNRDYKSGYSWDVDYLDEVQALQIPDGADIKTVWEVCRLEFLVQIALAAFLVRDDATQRNKYIVEYRNIVCDFFASNPVGVGCCWIHAMEAGIRAMNLLIAHSIIVQIDDSHVIDLTFEKIFAREMVLHGKFIWDNPEKGLFSKSGTNHYYSDIVGLLYVSYSLDSERKSLLQRWKRESTKEFLRESRAQFYLEGTNIECSTAYHCFMTELLVFGCAILDRFHVSISNQMKESIVRAAAFIKTITKQNGNIVQIGDNDSGRAVTITETSLNRNATISYCSGLYLCGIIKNDSKDIEGMLIQAITKKKPQQISTTINLKQTRRKENEKRYPVQKRMIFNYSDVSSRQDWGYYPSFGLYFFKQGDLEFYLYTGGDEGRKCKGHSHNDILHCEITIGGKEIAIDCGTYVYIPLERRKQLRGKSGHFVPDYGMEPRELISAWGYEGNEQMIVMELDVGKITVSYRAAGGKIDHERSVHIEDGLVEIMDRGMKEFKIHQHQCGWFSKGYGEIEERIN